MHPRTHKEGDRYGRLLNVEAYVRKDDNGRWFHLMQCDCGALKEVAGGELKKGTVNSCGCLRTELAKTHGMTKNSEYWVWAAMRQRCDNPNDKQFYNYGGRGISVCKEWSRFENFISDMGRKPCPESTLERIDNERGYEPDNCKWASRAEQSINQRIRKDNKTGHKGVYHDQNRDIYFSKITKDKKSHFLGYFKSKSEAVEARQKAEQKYFNTEVEL